MAARNINNKFRYLGLIRAISLTDFKLKYQGSVLGYLWSLMKPLMVFTVMYFVFTRIFRVGGRVEHYPAYLLLGLVVWEYFTEVTSGAMNSIVSKGSLIRKVYFPRIVLVISRSLTALLTFLLNFVVILGFMAFLKVPIRLEALLFPLLVIELTFLVMGISFFMSALFVKFRDLAHIWAVVTRALFYATPILYPLSIVPENARKFLMLNPVAQIIQDARYILITEETLRASDALVWKYVWIPYVIPFIAFAIGLFVFEKSAAKFAEEV